MRPMFAAACALGLATLLLAQAPQTSVMVYDARPLLRPFAVTDPPHLLPLHAAFSDDTLPQHEGRVLDEDHLLEFVRTAAGEQQSVEIDSSGGQIFVKGSASSQQAIAALMNHLSRTLLQEVTVELYALPSTLEGQAAVLTSAEVDRLLSGKTAPVELARSVVLLGQPGRIRAGKATSFVSDYDVEVAQNAAIGDPVIRVLQEGLDFQAGVGQAADGRILVRFGCTRCALAEALTARTVASTRLGDIQLPKVRSTVVSGSGLLEDGGGLVARHDGGLGSATLIRVRRAPAPTKVANLTNHFVLFADDLLSPPLRLTIPSVRDDQKKKSGDTGTPSEPLMEETSDGVVTAEMLNGVIRNALGEDNDTSFEVIGTRVHVSRGTEAKVQAIREAFEKLAKTLSRNVTVEFKIGRIEGGGPIAREPDELLSKLGMSVSVPTSLSDQFLIAGGLEQSAIIDQDVEIAQQAQIADPIVAPLFNGYVISGVASASGSDRIELVLDLQYQELLPWPNPAFASRAENVGPVDLPQVDSTIGRYKLLLESGRWTVVTASNPGESSALVILARARW